jgi:uroporphyrinogen III methyltransferase/synthase
VQAAGLTAPAVIFIGDVVGVRKHLTWFEELPLFGRRVLVTRPRRQANDLVLRLTELGAVPLVLPAVEIREPGDWGPVDQALSRLSRYEWLVFTSANGVHAFLGRLRHTGRDLRALGGLKIAAIGPKTAEALREYYLHADLVPARYQSEDLSAAIRENMRPGDRILLARADRGRALLRDELAAVAEVEQIAVYSQVSAIGSASAVLDSLRRGDIEFILLTSSNIARALIDALDPPSRQRIEGGETLLVSISPVTSAEIRSLGLPVAAEAARATQEALVQALLELATRGS